VKKEESMYISAHIFSLCSEYGYSGVSISSYISKATYLLTSKFSVGMNYDSGRITEPRRKKRTAKRHTALLSPLRRDIACLLGGIAAKTWRQRRVCSARMAAWRHGAAVGIAQQWALSSENTKRLNVSGEEPLLKKPHRAAPSMK